MDIYSNFQSASSSVHGRQSTKVNSFCFFHWLLLIVLLWLQCSNVSAVKIPDHADMCLELGKPMETYCPQGGYIYNQNPNKCPDRYICYRKSGQSCDIENEEYLCAPTYTCRCGSCQNCNEKDCFQTLCPSTVDYKRWMKRVGRNLLGWGGK